MARHTSQYSKSTQKYVPFIIALRVGIPMLCVSLLVNAVWCGIERMMDVVKYGREEYSLIFPALSVRVSIPVQISVLIVSLVFAASSAVRICSVGCLAAVCVSSFVSMIRPLIDPRWSFYNAHEIVDIVGFLILWVFALVFQWECFSLYCSAVGDVTGRGCPMIDIENIIQNEVADIELS